MSVCERWFRAGNGTWSPFSCCMGTGSGYKNLSTSVFRPPSGLPIWCPPILLTPYALLSRSTMGKWILHNVLKVITSSDSLEIVQADVWEMKGLSEAKKYRSCIIAYFIPLLIQHVSVGFARHCNVHICELRHSDNIAISTLNGFYSRSLNNVNIVLTCHLLVCTLS